MLQETFETAADSENAVALAPRHNFLIDELAIGHMNNRLQACVNLLHLLGTDGSLSEQARLLVTHLTSEIALLRSILRRSIESASQSCAIGVAP